MLLRSDGSRGPQTLRVTALRRYWVAGGDVMEVVNVGETRELDGGLALELIASGKAVQAADAEAAPKGKPKGP